MRLNKSVHIIKERRLDHRTRGGGREKALLSISPHSVNSGSGKVGIFLGFEDVGFRNLTTRFSS